MYPTKVVNTRVVPERLVQPEPLYPPSCETAPPGSEIQVFCQVQKYPRIVVLPRAYGYLGTIELNQCQIIGTVDQKCGCCGPNTGCYPTPSDYPYRQDGKNIVINDGEPRRTKYDPNPPFPFVPPEKQIQQYNLAATLNQCDVNKSNFINNRNSYEKLWTPVLN